MSSLIQAFLLYLLLGVIGFSKAPQSSHRVYLLTEVVPCPNCHRAMDVLQRELKGHKVQWLMPDADATVQTHLRKQLRDFEFPLVFDQAKWTSLKRKAGIVAGPASHLLIIDMQGNLLMVQSLNRLDVLALRQLLEVKE